MKRQLVAPVLALVTMAVDAALASGQTGPMTNDRTARAVSAMPVPSCSALGITSPRDDEIPSIAGMDSTGRYIVGGFLDGASPKPAIVEWVDGVPTILNGAPGQAEAMAVNASGTIAGRSRPNGIQSAWVYSRVGFRELPMPPEAYEASAQAINARGDIVGWAIIGILPEAVIWPADGPPRYLAPNVSVSYALAVTDDGTAFGTAGDGVAPLMWTPDGIQHLMPTPDRLPRGKVMGAAGDWAYGWVSNNKPGGLRWVRWHLPSQTVQVLADSAPSFAPRAVSATGVLAGSLEEDGSVIPALWRNGTIERLPAHPRSGSDFGVARSIDASATTVVGSVGVSGGEALNVQWRC